MATKDKELIEYNLQGLIPGPGEDEEAFLARADYCLKLRSQCAIGESGLPSCVNNDTSIKLLEEAFPLTKPLYDIEPAWLPIVFSNDKLAPWHGGCAWIFQVKENSPSGAILQLREKFLSCKKYIGFYQRDELIAHELSHVGRMKFEEPQFEELLAYRSSPTAWRSWLGPIVQAPWESLLFMLSLLLVLALDLYLQFSGEHETYQRLFWAKAFPIGMLLLGLTRVWKRQNTFDHCLANLKKISAEHANAIAYRLTDSEIQKFANDNSQAILAYVQEQKNLRWRLIKLAYFKASLPPK